MTSFIAFFLSNRSQGAILSGKRTFHVEWQINNLAMARKYSPYFYELVDTEKQRYTEKLEALGGVDDPYVEEPSIVGEDLQQFAQLLPYPAIDIEVVGFETLVGLQTFIGIHTWSLDEIVVNIRIFYTWPTLPDDG